MTDIHGSYQEYIVPSSNNSPGPGIFSPDGNQILLSTLSTDEVNKYGTANFYIMTLATPVPEFSIGIMALAGIGIAVIVCMSRLKK